MEVIEGCKGGENFWPWQNTGNGSCKTLHKGQCKHILLEYSEKREIDKPWVAINGPIAPKKDLFAEDGPII